MPRTVTLTFDDGSQHVYQGVPDDATPDAVQARGARDFAGKKLAGMDGGKSAGPDVGAAFAQGQAHTLIPGAPDASEPPPVPNSPNRLAGLPGAAVTMASAIPATIAGNVGGALSRAGGASMTEAGQRAKDIAGKLTYEPSPSGAAALDTIGHVFDESKLGGLNPGMALPSIPAVGAAFAKGETAVRGGAGALASKLTAEREAKATQAAPNAAKLTKAQAQGYTLLPTETNPSALNSILEGIAGPQKTAQKASLKNAPVTNQLVQKRFGIDEPITPMNPASGEGPLADIRAQHGEKYDAVRGVGEVPVDGELMAKIVGLDSRQKSAAKSFPNSPMAQNDPVAALKKAFTTENGEFIPSFSADSAIDEIWGLRGKSDQLYRQGDKTAGSAYRAAATALEDQIGRHLENIGADPKIISDFRNARKVIAQTYAVEPAAGESGNVSAQALARKARTTPLTDELKDVADFASVQPKAVQRPEKLGSVTAISPLDFWGGALKAGKMVGNALTLGARPAIRSAILSKPYQRMFVQPQDYAKPGLIERIAGAVAGEGPKPEVPAAAGSAIPGIDFTPPNLDAMKAENLSLGNRGPAGNEIDMGPFLRERAAAPSANIEELVRRIDELSRTSAQLRKTAPPASLEHNLQWLTR